jgi:hypothetical protein
LTSISARAVSVPERLESRRLLPRLGMADPDRVGAGGGKRTNERLADRGLAVGDQHLAEFGIAGHLAQLSIVGHVRYVLIGKTHQHCHSGPVQPCADPHARRWIPDVAVQMCYDGRAAVEPDQPEPPRHALAEVEIVAVTQQRLRKQLPRAILLAPDQAVRQARLADLARRVLCGRAAPADLQLEASFGRRGRHAERDPAARPRRQRQLPCRDDRVAALRSRECACHATSARARIAAPVQSPRS